MSSPLHLSLSSEIVSSLSSLNMYPDNKHDVYISNLYPETILATKYLNLALDTFINSDPIVFVDFENLKKAVLNEDYKLSNCLSISDELSYRKNLLLAKNELLKIKNLHYEIKHSIEHIDSALSFTIIKIKTYFLKPLYFSYVKNELLKIKNLHYEIKHSIEHIDSALSFTIIKIKTYFLKPLYFSYVNIDGYSFEEISHNIYDFIILESNLLNKKEK